ncbi:pro-resilin-like [Panulirus ornatus]|uniref:pro-resilin-like n=1 Tax=Panulirus ornatus TaxID=150431 RepID=UPI003A86EF46
MKGVVLVLCVAGAAWAGPEGYVASQGSGDGQGGQSPTSAPATYLFQWAVNDAPSGNSYGHSEQRDGDVTQGNYYVQLPDSRLLRVEYIADSTGYHPVITYEGEAKFPPSQPGQTGSSGQDQGHSYSG